ncbi:MAG: Ppx/GppA family phosphatase [Thermodesulfovibrionia bacterium]|nr:Ppx/GppA family phosphatase [Thermodesulfovibrionia bacterium]
MKNRPLAAIDIGTNTFRLLIAKVKRENENGYRYSIGEIRSERIITRLGQGIPEKGLIQKQAITKSIAALKKFSDIIAEQKVHKTSAVATSALRDAENSDEFIKKVKEITELDIKIITGEEEAKKTLSGILIDIKQPNTALMVDIGGGSTELIFSKKGTPSIVQSLNLGVVYLAGTYMKHDPPLDKELNQMAAKISQEIMAHVKTFKKHISEDTACIGTAGTITTLAAVSQGLTEFEHSKIHGMKITIEKIKSIFSDIASVTAHERAQYIPFERERLDIIVPGTRILLTLMEAFGFKEVMVSNYGLREGILIDLYEKNISK